MEKAYAKMNVNYESLDYARPENVVEGLRALSGMPVVQIKDGEEGFLDNLQKYFMNNYALNVYLDRDIYGLEKDHTYNIVDLIAIKGGKKTKDFKIEAVMLRDPWTGGENVAYDGPKYNKNGVKRGSDGNKTFVMPIDDFRKTFGTVFVTMIAQNWAISQKHF